MKQAKLVSELSQFDENAVVGDDDNMGIFILMGLFW